MRLPRAQTTESRPPWEVWAGRLPSEDEWLDMLAPLDPDEDEDASTGEVRR